MATAPRKKDPPIPTSLDWDEPIGLLPDGTLNEVDPNDPTPNVDNDEDVDVEEEDA